MKQISESQVLLRLRQDNPWWAEPAAVPEPFASWAPRAYLDLVMPLIRESALRRAVVLMGPRRVGKTVLLHHAIGSLIKDGVDPQTICYVSVDHPIYNQLHLEQLIQHFKQAASPPDGKAQYYFFDEIQYLREWEVHLKALVDAHTHSHIVVSGSAAAALRLGSTESGAGRFTEFLLPPLMFREYLDLTGQSGLVESGEERVPVTTSITDLNRAFVSYLNFGGYPELALSDRAQSDPRRFIKSDIIDKVLLRDLPSLYGVQDIQELNSLFTTLAFNTGGEVSLEQLSQNSGVGKNTIKKYIEYLQAAFLIKTVQRVDQSAKRFKRANYFKVHLTNPSIHSALFDRLDDDQSGSLGSLVETGVFAQWFHADLTLHYARWDSGRSEIDLIGLRPDQAPDTAIEVKWSDRCVESFEGLKALLSFSRRHKASLNARAFVTTRTYHGVKTRDGITVSFIPSALFCLMIGEAILSGKRSRLLV